MPKRKRESSAPTEATGQAQAGPSSSKSTPTPKPSSRKGKGKAVATHGGDAEKEDATGPMVHYSSADGRHWWSARLNSGDDLRRTLEKAALEVGLPEDRAGDMKVSYLRDGGREAEIWDDFDYNAFKARAKANPSAHLSMKIYTPRAPMLSVGLSSSQVTAAPSTSATPPVPSSKKGSSSAAKKTKKPPATPSASAIDTNPSITVESPASHTGSKVEAKKTKKAKDTPADLTPGALASAAANAPVGSTGTAELVESRKKRLSEAPAHDDGVRIAQHATQTESSPSVQPPQTDSAAASVVSVKSPERERKQALATSQPVSPDISPALHGPAGTAAPAAQSGGADKGSKRKVRRKRSENGVSGLNPALSPATSSPTSQAASSPPTTPSPGMKGPHPLGRHVALNFAERYKPARPSPLGNSIAPHASPVDSANSDEQTAKKGRRHRNRKSKRQGRFSEQGIQTSVDLSPPLGIEDRPVTGNDGDDNTVETAAPIEEHSPPRKKLRQTDVAEQTGDNVPSSSTEPGLASTDSGSTLTGSPAAPLVSHPIQEHASSDLQSRPTNVETSTAATQTRRSPVKKVVALSANYDLLRRPNESQRNSSSISGSTRRKERAASSISQTSQNESGLSGDEDVDLDALPATRLPTSQGETDRGNPPDGAKRIQSENTSVTVPAVEDTLSNPVTSTSSGAHSRADHTVDAARTPGREKILTPKKKAPHARQKAPVAAGDAVGNVSTASSTMEPPPAEAPTSVRDSALATSQQSQKDSSALEHEDVTSMHADAESLGGRRDVLNAVDERQDVSGVSTSISTGTTREGEDDNGGPDLGTAPSSRSSAANKTTKARATKRVPKSKGPDPPCSICLQTPSHLQKDCPEVKAGPDNLRYLLSARKDQQESLGAYEDGTHFAASIELIEWWLNRTSKIASQVQGDTLKDQANGFLPRSPLKVMGTKTGEAIDLNAPSPKQVKGRRKKAGTPPDSVIDRDGDVTMASPESTTITLAATNPAANPSMADPEPTTEPAAGDQSAAPPDAPVSSFPPIHLRAMQKARRPGSLSGLSVSDAFIETEPSDDSSSEDDGSADSDVDHVSSDDDDVGSEAETESQASSVVSSSSALSSSTDTTTASATSRIPLPANPSNAISFSLTRELSEREKKKARLSAAKMKPVSFDSEIESALEDEDADVKEPSEPPSPLKRPAYIRAGSDSSIGDFEDDASRRSSIDSTIQPPYLSQAPPIIASSTQPDAADVSGGEPSDKKVTPGSGGDSSPDRSQSPMVGVAVDHERSQSAIDHVGDTASTPALGSRSFRNLNGVAGSSPDLDDSPGVQAVRRSIAEEESPDDALLGQSQPETIEAPIPTQPVNRRRSSSRTTVEVVITSPRRRSSRTSVTASPVKRTHSIEPDNGLRRLRSTSLEVRETTPPASMRSTRSVSRSKASVSPSASTKIPPSPNTPRAGGLAGRAFLPEIVMAESEQATPKAAPKKRGRPARASQATQLESSLPIIEESSLPESSLPESQSVAEAATQSTPVRQSKDASASPLFMTQGSQIPATQYYDPQPETMTEGDESYETPIAAQVSPKKVKGRPTGARKQLGESQDITTTPASSSQTMKAGKAKSKKANGTSRSSPGPSQNAPQSQISGDSAASLPAPPRSPASPPLAKTNPHESDANDSASSSSSDDDDDAGFIPDIAPPTIRHLPSSQPSSTTPIYPSLSSLSKDWLRRTTSFLGGMGSTSQPLTPQAGYKANGNGKATGGGAVSESDSGSGSDSSDDETRGVPSAIKNRFASGGMSKKRKSASQPAGW